MAEGEKAPEMRFFHEDVVCLKSNPAKLGFISRVADDPDSDSESDEEESDEELQPGEADVCWLKADDEETVKTDDLELVDRSFLHGDIVAKQEDPLGQSGWVMGVNMVVDLEYPDGRKLANIRSERLQHIRNFRPGNYVVHGMWVGRVEDVTDNVVVMFEDGSKCRVGHACTERLMPVLELATDDENECPYYPGQHVRGSTSSVFRHAKYLRGSWKPKHTVGVVCTVEPDSVTVHWVISGKPWGDSGQGEQAVGPPPESIDGKNLFALSHFVKTSWQVGDHCLLQPDLTETKLCPLADPTESERSEEPSTSEPKPSSPTPTNSVSKRKKKRKAKLRAAKAQADSTASLQVVHTKTLVDVYWQDGSKSFGLHSASLIPVHHVGAHDFWPEEFALESPQADEVGGSSPRPEPRQGVVKKINAKEMTAVVKWFSLSDDVSKPVTFESEEEVSVYELSEHPDYTYRVGDVVIRLSGNDRSAVVRTEHQSNTENDTGQSTSGSEAAESDKAGAPPGQQEWIRNLSWVGEISGSSEGMIEVAWGDGAVSSVGPQAIYVVSNEDDDDHGGADDDEDEEEDDEDEDDNASWETMSVTAEDIPAEDVKDEGDILEEQKSAARSSQPDDATSPLSAPPPANPPNVDTSGGTWMGRIVKHLMGGVPEGVPQTNPPLPAGFKLAIVGDGGTGPRPFRELELAAKEELARQSSQAEKTGEPSQPDGTGQASETVATGHTRQPERTGQPDGPEQSSQPERTGQFDGTEQSKQPDRTGQSDGTEQSSQPERTSCSSNGTLEESAPRGGTTAGPSEGGNAGKELKALPHLECLAECPEDHNFLQQVEEVTTNRQWSRKVQKEWELLGKSLPGSIYVHVYEGRMDLLRSVIIGAAGTPYHDGLFFFDFYLPPEYPAAPPLVHYLSGGLHLNPNLYAEGKVCLSLLNTWQGKGSEVWHPERSNMLQVLVSIQGLVLNDKPYFNEAGYEKQVGTGEGEKNSFLYNESAFLLSCKSMLYLLRRPPQKFESFVKLHFQQRGAHILRCCDAYLDGAGVGSLKAFCEGMPTQAPAESSLGDQEGCSAGFRIVLAKLRPKLELAFKDIQALR